MTMDLSIRGWPANSTSIEEAVHLRGGLQEQSHKDGGLPEKRRGEGMLLKHMSQVTSTGTRGEAAGLFATVGGILLAL